MFKFKLNISTKIASNQLVKNLVTPRNFSTFGWSAGIHRDRFGHVSVAVPSERGVTIKL